MRCLPLRHCSVAAVVHDGDGLVVIEDVELEVVMAVEMSMPFELHVKEPLLEVAVDRDEPVMIY